MKEFKIRASGSGKIMGIKGLGKTGESYLEEWVKEQVYDRKKSFTNKYTEKGLIMEDNSLDYVAQHLGYGMLIKNEEFFSDEFIQGTPDVILNDHIIDVKNSWDCFTFPLFDTEIPNKDYYYQAQCYMHLCNKEYYKLIYVLMNTPEHLIEKEFKWNNPMDLEYQDFELLYKWDNIEPSKRIKIFEIKRNQTDIDKIIERVKECRIYINKLNN